MKNSMSKLSSHQSGLVSYVVVSAIMIVLTIIVLSFARTVQREQRQTLDRQLNTQAQYAAESGINDALNELARNPGLADADYTECDEFMNAASLDGELGDGVNYSCLLLDPTPSELKFDITPQHSVATEIRPSSGTIDSLTIAWKDLGVGGDVTGCGNAIPQDLPPDCDIGYLRFELVDFSSQRSRQDLMEGSRAIGFLRPHSTGSSTRLFSDFSNTNQGRMEGVVCSDGECSLEITDLTMNRGYLRLKSIYKNVDVTVTARDSSGRSVNFIGSQVAIDATGRAGGVVKRMKVHRVLDGGVAGQFGPEFALQSRESICKRFQYIAGSPGNPGSINERDSFVMNTDDGTKSVCNPLDP